jgi:hypothetical protein
MPIERYGALAVVRQAHSKDETQRLIRQYDDRLFLEQQLGFDGRVVWCVVCQVGGDQMPLTILEWRDQETGEPINELTSGLVERVARMERDGKKLATRVIQANQAKIEYDRQKSRAEYEELAREHERSASGKRSPVFHRSPGLVAARRRARERGENV